MLRREGALLIAGVLVLVGCAAATQVTQAPGVRGGPPGAGGPLPGLTSAELAFFQAGLATFREVEAVKDGLGPRFNLDSCAGCHAQPATGGSSPFVNPQIAVATKGGAKNIVPSFIALNGPVREARFKFKTDRTRDGGVHNLYTISGRSDASGCVLAQPDFEREAASNNLIFRIPTPVFGAGLMENISDEAILSNMSLNQQQKQALGISGHPNRDGNDGAISRFGWKAQNKSLEIFAGEAYNVEMGVTNELFQNERASPDEAQNGGLPANCKVNPTPEDTTNFAASPNYAVPSDTVQFAMFMRLLAPPTASTTVPGGATSISNGSQVFGAIGCAMCHTPTLATAPSSFVAGLGPGQANLFSDLLVHHMGTNLADGVSQGGAGPDEFRSAPLWGLGQRIFLLHDGRTKDLVDAIREHASDGSEANRVIHNFNRLSPQQEQDLLNFLRSL